MIINELLINIVALSENTSDPSQVIEYVFLSVASIIFFALALLMMVLYFRLKPTQSSYSARFQHRAAFSFAGFWGRNRLMMIAFFGFVFMIISAFFLFAIIGISLQTEGLYG